MEKSRNYVLKNFVQVAVDSTQILDLNIADFHGIVNDEMLNVKVCKRKAILIRRRAFYKSHCRMNKLCGNACCVG